MEVLYEGDLLKPLKPLEEKWKLVPAFLQLKGLVKQHLESFNFFLNTDIKEILKANKEITCESNPGFKLTYTDINIGKPSIEENGILYELTPQECRIRDLTYAAPILVDMEYVRGEEMVSRTNVQIGSMPIMLGCTHCALYGQSSVQLAKLKECPYDPKGYFIVKGVEKVILIHEQSSKNRILVELDAKKDLCATVTSSTHMKQSRTQVVYRSSRFYLRHNIFSDDIPIILAFKAIGIESDQEIVQLVASESAFVEKMTMSMEENHQRHSEFQALSYIAGKIKQSKAERTGRTRTEEAKDILTTTILSHVPVENEDFRPKARFLALMVRRLLEAERDGGKVDDRDYYGNKRLEMAGQLVGLLFEDLLKRFNSDIQKQADLYFQRAHRNSTEPFDAVKAIRLETITMGLNQAISTGNWVVKRFKIDRAGITEVVSRLSYISALGNMTRVNSNFEKTRKISGPRSLQASQFGMLCPLDTPEGESCGLVKNLALSSHVTTDLPEAPIARLAFDLGVQDATLFPSGKSSFLVFINGQPIGTHADGHFLVNSFRYLRRRGRVSESVNIYLQEEQRQVYIACDGGRIIRPFLVLEKGQSKLTEQGLRELALGVRDFTDFVREGVVEFLDVNEEGNSQIAMEPKDITLDKTHLEIAPFTIFGALAGVIPFPNHNQTPRNTFQCAMGKQAIGAIAYNQFQRVDNLLYLLTHPQTPLVKSKTIDLIHYDQLPAGTNASVAVMSYSAYDIEDAIIMNRAAIDRGFGRCHLMRRWETKLKIYSGMVTREGAVVMDGLITPPEIYSANPPPSLRRFHGLGRDGMAAVGQVVREGDVLVNKQVPKNVTDSFLTFDTANRDNYKDDPTCYKGPNPVSIQSVILTSTPDDPLIVKTITLETRRPELGDKFSSRHGQKGVVGLIVGQEDLPFSETGWCPDLIMNPHGYPSRMTVGKLMELLAGKAAVFDGKRKYGTAFEGDPIGECGRVLVSRGFSYTGKDILMSGITGELLSVYVFSGPIYYQKLKHMVADKMHARATGPKTSLTRQPTEGRSREGGQRLGEMERDCLIGYGAAALLQERLLFSSDVFQASVCEECGFIGAKDRCEYCQSGQAVIKVKMPYACKLLFQELMAMGILPKIKLGSL